MLGVSLFTVNIEYRIDVIGATNKSTTSEKPHTI